MRAKKVDSNQKEIVAKLRDAGVQVVLLSDAGCDRPDLLLCWREWVLCEIKMPGGEFSRGQLDFISKARGHIGIAPDFETAHAIARRPEMFCVGQRQKERIAAFLMRWKGESISLNKLFKELAA